VTNFWQKRAYAELSTSPDDLGKRGLVYLLDRFFTVPGTGSVHFGLATNGVEVEFQFYDITTISGIIQAELIEAPTVTLFGPQIIGRNLNRNFPDNQSVTLQAASGVSGGTRIASELLGNDSKAGGVIAQTKIHTLKPQTTYVMAFFNSTNQSTLTHLNLGWSEGEPDPYPLVLNTSEGGTT
jgi:hypothetical protein